MKTLLSPKELGAAIGVSESSLKRWADSGHLKVARTAGGHRRIYLSEAVRFIRKAGFPVLRPEILGLSGAGPDTSGDSPAATFHTALRNGEEQHATGIILQEYLSGGSMAEIIDDIMAPAMRDIGHLWHTDDDGIYVEHRASDICFQALDRIRGLNPVSDEAPVAMGCVLLDDTHSLCSLMAATVLATEGWSVINLSTSTPTHVLARAARANKAGLVWVAVGTFSPGHDHLAALAELRSLLDEQTQQPEMVVGGPAVAHLSADDLPGIGLAPSMADLATFARDLRARREPPATESAEVHRD